MAHPFLKWAGGKKQLLAQFQPFYPRPEDVGRYLEPFVGSGAVFFRVQTELAPRSVVLADNNPELINTYESIHKDVEAVIGHLEEHRRQHCKEHYYEVRKEKPRSDAARAARFIYLNKTCFNGLYRVNSRGLFNVPMGSYKNPGILDEQNLREVSRALVGASLKVAHFSQTLKYARRGDFIYFDPPYDPVSETAYFTSYTEGAFGRPDQEQLADVFAALARKGCRVMLSNSDTPFIRKLYRDFQVETVRATRMINSKAERRGAINEVVVLSYSPPGAGAEGAGVPHPTRRGAPHPTGCVVAEAASSRPRSRQRS